MNDSAMSTGDKAGKDYWDAEWTGRQIPTPVDPRAQGLRNYVYRAFHREFTHALDGITTRGSRLLEIGCGRSAWLPYFAREFGFDISGLDYSELGCAQEREVLSRAGLEGNIVCANLFDPPKSMFNAFDVVISLGVVEHFQDTANCIRACARFLRPGGRMITEVPNMAGMVGWITRLINQDLFDIHVPLDQEALLRAHQDAGLSIVQCNYILPMDWSVLGFGHIQSPWLRKTTMGASFALVSLLWMLDDRGIGPKPNAITSPYILCVANKIP